jgi:adenylate kinase
VVPDIVFVLGGPGSGKGTQCAKIAEDYGFVHLSAGDLLRSEIQRGSKDGSLIAGMIREGKIVPQEITIRLLKKALHQTVDKNKFLVDGFPRAIPQAQAFEQMVGKAKFCLFFDTSDQVLTDRLLNRGKTSGRTDDNADAIVKRLATYHNQSRPVIQHFSTNEPSGFVQTIDATPGVDQVYKEVEKVFANYSKQKVVWVTGQPLSGKTMLSNRLALSHQGVHLNFADLLKAETLSNSQTGRKIGGYIRRAERVPQELIVHVVKSAIDRANGGLLVLDGFPRKPSEAELLFSQIGEPHAVMFLDTAAAGQPDSVSIERIKQFDTDGDGMLSKEEFAAAGHIGVMLERSEKEGGTTVPEMMKKLDSFSEETQPLIDKYEKMGKLRRRIASQSCWLLILGSSPTMKKRRRVKRKMMLWFTKK